MKVRFFPEGDLKVPGSRYRVYYMADKFSEMNINNDIVYPIIPNIGTKIFPKKLYFISKNILVRFYYGVRRTNKTILFVHRGQNQYGFYWILLILKKIFRKTIVFDFDDAIFLQRPGIVKKTIKLCDCIIVGSHFLEKYSKRLNKCVYLVPTSVIIPNCLTKKQSNNKEIIIGWMGGISTAKYLDVLINPLEEISKKYRVKLRIFGLMGNKEFLPKFRKTELDIVDWVNPNNLSEEISKIDIGVMPLHNSMWERGKCALKALEYMANGVPAVCSRVGENTFVIQDGKDGFLCTESKEWIIKLSKLINDKKLRNKIGYKGRKKTQMKYSLENNAGILAGILRELK